MRKEISDLIDRGALFVANHSAGKDSQAMLIYLRKIIPAEQLVVIHADLPGVEWEGTWDHIQDTAGDLSPIRVTAGKTFFEMVERRAIKFVNRLWE